MNAAKMQMECEHKCLLFLSFDLPRSACYSSPLTSPVLSPCMPDPSSWSCMLSPCMRYRGVWCHEQSPFPTAPIAAPIREARTLQ